MRIGRVYRCTAIGTEGVSAFVAAFRRFNVDLGCSRSQHETGRGRLHIDSIGGAGERLAISAVTNPHSARVDLGFKGNLSAVATAFDFHGLLPALTGLCRPSPRSPLRATPSCRRPAPRRPGIPSGAMSLSPASIRGRTRNKQESSWSDRSAPR